MEALEQRWQKKLKSGEPTTPAKVGQTLIYYVNILLIEVLRETLPESVTGSAP